ncbi:MAG: hypothetical protein H0V26_02425 [Solirubrobacterales bacterium]|nr:hypothetical protein [Solirubrobacterales bacterium]
MPASPPPDRYEPLPGLLGLPAHLWRKLSARGRRATIVLGLLVALLGAIGIVFVAPDARRTERERTARQDAAIRAAAFARRERLNGEARPRRSRGPSGVGLRGAAQFKARRTLFASVEASILADARARTRTGELRGGPYRTSACFTYPKGLDQRPPPEDLGLGIARLECLAVSTVLPGDDGARGSLVGQPYRARVNFASGRYAWCKIVQRPGEGSIGRPAPVRISRACGGDS